MKAKDTVCACPCNDCRRWVQPNHAEGYCNKGGSRSYRCYLWHEWVGAKAQAEITWKARDPEIEEAGKAGRQEVVDFFQTHNDAGVSVEDYQKRSPHRIFDISERSLQTFLKSKGLSEVKHD